jgi:phosphoglycolate phosphatase
MSAYDGLLLDHDGVLVELVSRERLAAGLRTHGEPRLRALGVNPDPALFDAFGVGAERAEIRDHARRHGVDPGALWRCRDDAVETTLRVATRAGQKEPYDGVAALAGLDVPRGVVSNNQRRIVEFVLATHGIDDLFGTVRARDPTLASLDRKKPAPVYLDEAAADLDIERPLYVGDSETDVLAARRAGVDTVFLRRGHNADTSLSAAPTYEASTLDEVVEILRTGRPTGDHV